MRFYFDRLIFLSIDLNSTVPGYILFHTIYISETIMQTKPSCNSCYQNYSRVLPVLRNC